MTSEEVVELIRLRDIWRFTMPTFVEALRLRDLEDKLQKDVPDFKRLTPRRRGIKR